jgi:hypothetical protein
MICCQSRPIRSREPAALRFRRAPTARARRGTAGSASLSVPRADPPAVGTARAKSGPEARVPNAATAHPCAATNGIARFMLASLGIWVGIAYVMPSTGGPRPCRQPFDCDARRLFRLPVSPERVRRALDRCIILAAIPCFDIERMGGAGQSRRRKRSLLVGPHDDHCCAPDRAQRGAAAGFADCDIEQFRMLSRWIRNNRYR